MIVRRAMLIALGALWIAPSVHAAGPPHAPPVHAPAPAGQPRPHEHEGLFHKLLHHQAHEEVPQPHAHLVNHLLTGEISQRHYGDGKAMAKYADGSTPITIGGTHARVRWLEGPLDPHRKMDEVDAFHVSQVLGLDAAQVAVRRTVGLKPAIVVVDDEDDIPNLPRQLFSAITGVRDPTALPPRYTKEDAAAFAQGIDPVKLALAVKDAGLSSNVAEGALLRLAQLRTSANPTAEEQAHAKATVAAAYARH
jgi:hypothetical protein